MEGVWGGGEERADPGQWVGFGEEEKWERGEKRTEGKRGRKRHRLCPLTGAGTAGWGPLCCLVAAEDVWRPGIWAAGLGSHV